MKVRLYARCGNQTFERIKEDYPDDLSSEELIDAAEALFWNDVGGLGSFGYEILEEDDDPPLTDIGSPS